eukprot:c18061_g1_i2.p1 GENE.c18061_g1_i2~~c18061_g1_i2.p1  ORF type:complete len:214 (+),score=14.18 c18061_g1_i2:273-914(+)
MPKVPRCVCRCSRALFLWCQSPVGTLPKHHRHHPIMCRVCVRTWSCCGINRSTRAASLVRCPVSRGSLRSAFVSEAVTSWKGAAIGVRTICGVFDFDAIFLPPCPANTPQALSAKWLDNGHIDMSPQIDLVSSVIPSDTPEQLQTEIESCASATSYRDLLLLILHNRFASGLEAELVVHNKGSWVWAIEARPRKILWGLNENDRCVVLCVVGA